MDIAISPQNKNEYIYKTILDGIRSGTIPAGARLPSEKELAARYSCSRITIRRALERLDENQLIRRLQGNGTFVNGGDLMPSTDFRVGLVLDAEEDELYNDPWLSELLYGIISAGGKHPFNISVIPIGRGEDIGSALIKRGQNLHHYNGFISARELAGREIELLCSAQRPFVLLQNEGQKRAHSYVSVDNVRGAYLAAVHLLSIGCRNIYFLSPEKLPQLTDRMEGFRQALREFGLPDTPEDFMLSVAGDDYAGSERVMEDMLARQILFDGLLLGSDGCAYSAVTTLRKHSVRIPEEVSVIMWDDFPWVSKALQLPLTVVRQPFREQIVSAIEILMTQRNRQAISNIQKIIQPSLVVRCSCRTPSPN